MVSFVDNKTGVRVKPPKSPVFSDAVLWFTDALGSTPTIPQADWFNMIQAELLGMAEALGVTPDKLDDGQLGKALIAAFEKVGGDIANLPKVLDRLGDSAVDAASQRIVNVVNKLAKDAMQAANQANDKANQAKQEAYEAKQIGEDAKAEAKEAMDEILGNIPNSKNYPSIEGLESSTKGSIAIVNGEDVESKDSRNLYIKGFLKHNGYEFYPFAEQNSLSNQSRSNNFGGQLALLKSSLSNPLVQKMSIDFYGDSNVWGYGTKQNAPHTPKDGSINDARDHFASNSFVNLVKRYIGKKYFNNAIPELSNFPSSPSGESICTYTKDILLFPYDDTYFSSYKGSPSGEEVITERWNNTITGWRRRFIRGFTDIEPARIEFNFTGEKFGIYYTKANNAIALNIYVNGKLIQTIIGYNALTEYQCYEEIEFPYEKNALITLEVSMGGIVGSGGRNFYLEAIKIEKTVIVQNNAVWGSYTGRYNKDDIDKVIGKYDLFTFIQFGGNDRIANVSFGARCISTLTQNTLEIVDKLKSNDINPILMGTSPGTDRDGQLFSRQDAANAIESIAHLKNIDFIDNYSVLTGSNIYLYTDDGVHLNVIGNSLVARNIITAIESSTYQENISKRITSDILVNDEYRIASTKFVHDLIEGLRKEVSDINQKP